MILPLLKSTDARLRQAGLLALTGMFKGSPLALDKITPEMNEQVVKMLNDPNESWWVVLHAIEAMGRGDKSLIAPHRDRLLKLMEYKCTWIQTAAACTLAKISTEPDHYKIVLPAIVKQAASFRVDSASSRSTKAIADAMKAASPEVKTFADGILKKTYVSMPSVLKEPNTGAVLGGGGKVVKSRIGSIILRKSPKPRSNPTSAEKMPICIPTAAHSCRIKLWKEHGHGRFILHQIIRVKSMRRSLPSSPRHLRKLISQKMSSKLQTREWLEIPDTSKAISGRVTC